MWLVAVAATVGLVVAPVGTASARAEALSPWWGLTSAARPTDLPPEGKGEIVVTAQNRGDAGTSGNVMIVDKLPETLEAIGIKAIIGGTSEQGPVSCSLNKLTCTFGSFENAKKEVVPQVLPPFEEIEVRITVNVLPGASSGEVNKASVTGGGAARTVNVSSPIEVGAAQTFGFAAYQLIPENAGGTVDTQAGSHPFQVTNVVTLKSGETDALERPLAVGLPKDISDELPAGLIGNPTPFEQCTDKQFAAKPMVKANVDINECPAQSALGVATLKFSDPQGGFHMVVAPIFNVTPLAGEPARFGFKAIGLVSAFLDVSVRTGGDYGATISSSNITELTSLVDLTVTIWGVPGDSRHDNARGWECIDHFGTCASSTGTKPPPFLVMPTSCEAPFQATLHGDSWAAPGEPSQQAERTYRLPEAVDGCNHLPFSPEIRVTPDVAAASTSTGLSVDVHVPQGAVLNSESLAESAVRGITVALPEGVAVNPSGGDGLQACTEGEVGYLTSSGEGQLFTPSLPEPFCPDASKVGTVEIISPLLPAGQHVKGAVYLATQNENPFGSLIAMYIVARDPVSGVLVKQTGEVHLTATGQLVATFTGVPQLAFEDAEFHFFGGERAPLATPAHCGPYTTKATFVPWSGNQPIESSSTFQITSGPNGGSCPGASLPFSPSLTGGTININAGSFTTLTATLAREDGQQNLQSVQIHMPPGVDGLLSNVKLCPEAQANEGTCGPESQIGEMTVSAGVGSDPVSVTGGRVYLTEKYQGAPFGLSIVNPVKAGPFDLEHDTANPNQQPACDCLVVRALIEVDPRTGELTVTTDPEGPHAIPHLIDGVPVQIKRVNTTINREHFMFNPTNCSPLAMTGSIASDEGASQPLSLPFQVTNCAILKFAPKLTVSTAGRASKKNGASLRFKIAYPKGAMGTQSWLNEAKFSLPRQLPARLSTLQQACLAATFEHNRPACPAASIIGHATVHTPVLPVPLEGSLYFVSYGSAKFPDAVLVLKGYGVTIEQHGETFISHGVTSATFRGIPDVPFENLEVTVPQGPFSEFGVNLPAKANFSFCGQKLLMPTEFKASNGLEIHQNTPITVTGCPKRPKHHTHKGKTAPHAHKK